MNINESLNQISKSVSQASACPTCQSMGISGPCKGHGRADDSESACLCGKPV